MHLKVCPKEQGCSNAINRTNDLLAVACKCTQVAGSCMTWFPVTSLWNRGMRHIETTTSSPLVHVCVLLFFLCLTFFSSLLRFFFIKIGLAAYIFSRESLNAINATVLVKFKCHKLKMTMDPTWSFWHLHTFCMH